MDKYFNVRVYGLLVKDGHLLVSDEYCNGTYMTKLPGGGLEFGEGTMECVIREFMEETGLTVRVVRHFYTTDFFVLSQFNSKGQLISIYYVVETDDDVTGLPTVKEQYENLPAKEDAQNLRWHPLNNLNEEHLTLPVDKVVVQMLAEELAK
jgi:ADP-ribose pyrophosphatase YjhB (NUDIX family)